MLLHCDAGKNPPGFALALVVHAIRISIDDVMEGGLISRSTLGSADTRIPRIQALLDNTSGCDCPHKRH